ncbi:hypothetical protein [Pseudomonas sp.]|uniref:hypothetical protein n=1 Tax=Pseudomonas sp. TaxID=306 RepID=UPI002E35133F|nr:hypothetical protein [Pseudomonas sp.]HEX4550152.1 hypothetical protein [Pseudomonas sp.]
MDLPDIENTDDWLGCPTPLETCRHQLALYENEFEELNLQLRQARERIFKLVEINAKATGECETLRAQLVAARADIARLHAQTTELSSDLRALAKVEHQNVFLREENQRLLKARRER